MGPMNHFVLKVFGYSPFPITRHASDWGYPIANDPRPDNIFDDLEILERDFAAIKLMNANTLRIFKGNDTQAGARFPVFLTQQTFDTAEKI